MNSTHRMLLTALLAGLSSLNAPAAEWENAIISLQTTRKAFSYSRPWQRQSGSANKTAVMIGANEFLTTAEGLQDLTLLRLQKYGRGQWWAGELSWIDHHANIAVVRARDLAFNDGLKPVEIGTPDPSRTGWESFAGRAATSNGGRPSTISIWCRKAASPSCSTSSSKPVPRLTPSAGVNP